jgi:hypothetical protein
VQTYPVRADHRGNLEPAALEQLMTPIFEKVTRSGDAVSTSFGAIDRLVVRADGRGLSVDVTMNPKVPVEVAAETVQRYNRFLEAVTGYTAKERAKRLRKSATDASGD